ncbi:hypothetical protein J6590_009894 [Homalodisca vitripennis]|nr:hypothetical protein J6590_009894 [Homalodisca vitripennis]
MNPEEVNSWACSSCKKTNIDDHLRSNNDNSLLPKSNLADTDNTLADLQQKIKELNIEEPGLESSLTLAAEVGNVLLTENNKLKLDLQNKTSENTKLTQIILALKNYNEHIYPDQISMLEQENETLRNRISEVVELLDESEHTGKGERAKESGVYRPPSSNLDNAIDILTAELDKALTSNQAISIMGDINGDNLKNAEQKRN